MRSLMWAMRDYAPSAHEIVRFALLVRTPDPVF